MKDPQALPRLHIESANVPLRVVFDSGRSARTVGSADDHRVSGDNRCSVQTDVGRVEIEVLIVIKLQVNDTVAPERSNGQAGLRIQGDQAVAGSDIENPLFAAVAPVSEPAARQVSRRIVASLAFPLAVHPHKLARRRIECDDGPA